MEGDSVKVPAIKDYPKQIYIRGESYKISFVKNLDCLGITDSGARTIKIKAGMSPHETFRTAIHEVLHAIEFSWPVKIKHKTVYKLEKAIFDVLLDNGFLAGKK